MADNKKDLLLDEEVDESTDVELDFEVDERVTKKTEGSLLVSDNKPPAISEKDAVPAKASDVSTADTMQSATKQAEPVQKPEPVTPAPAPEPKVVKEEKVPERNNEESEINGDAAFGDADEEKSYKTVVALIAGIVVGALLTSLLL